MPLHIHGTLMGTTTATTHRVPPTQRKSRPRSTSHRCIHRGSTSGIKHLRHWRSLLPPRAGTVGGAMLRRRHPLLRGARRTGYRHATHEALNGSDLSRVRAPPAVLRGRPRPISIATTKRRVRPRTISRLRRSFPHDGAAISTTALRVTLQLFYEPRAVGSPTVVKEASRRGHAMNSESTPGLRPCCLRLALPSQHTTLPDGWSHRVRRE